MSSIVSGKFSGTGSRQVSAVSKSQFISGLLLTLCVLARSAAAADLKFTAVDPREALCHTPVVVDKMDPTPTGKLSSDAIVGVVPTADGDIHIAIDSRGAKEPQWLVIDASGTGAFTDVTAAKIVPVNRGRNFVGDISPTKLQVERNGQTFTVGVIGSVYRSGSRHSVDLQIGAALKSRCAFGDREVSVDIIDGDQNLRFGDKTSMERGRPVIGDTLIIRAKGKPMKVLYGQPVLVDSVWYELSLDDQFELTAKPLELATGQVQVKHREWEAILVGEKYIFGVEGDGKPIDVPVDTYRPVRYEERMGKALIACQGQGDTPVVVADGETVDLAIGSPIKGLPVMEQVGDELSIRARLVDAAGMEVKEFRTSNGRRPDPPVVGIFTPQGKQLYVARLEYG